MLASCTLAPRLAQRLRHRAAHTRVSSSQSHVSRRLSQIHGAGTQAELNAATPMGHVDSASMADIDDWADDVTDDWSVYMGQSPARSLTEAQHRKLQMDQFDKQCAALVENRHYASWTDACLKVSSAESRLPVRVPFVQHPGPQMPLAYVPRGVPLLHKGAEIILHPIAEEAAALFAHVVKTRPNIAGHAFVQRFFADFRHLLERFGGASPIPDLEPSQVDLSWLAKSVDMGHLDMLREKYNSHVIAHFSYMYGSAPVRVRRACLNPLSVHLSRESLAGRIVLPSTPEDVALNADLRSAVIAPPPGHKWKSVAQQPSKTWFARWRRKYADGSTVGQSYLRGPTQAEVPIESPFHTFDLAQKVSFDLQYIWDQVQLWLSKPRIVDGFHDAIFYLYVCCFFYPQLNNGSAEGKQAKAVRAQDVSWVYEKAGTANATFVQASRVKYPKMQNETLIYHGASRVRDAPPQTIPDLYLFVGDAPFKLSEVKACVFNVNGTQVKIPLTRPAAYALTNILANRGAGDYLFFKSAPRYALTSMVPRHLKYFLVDALAPTGMSRMPLSRALRAVQIAFVTALVDLRLQDERPYSAAHGTPEAFHCSVVRQVLGSVGQVPGGTSQSVAEAGEAAAEAGTAKATIKATDEAINSAFKDACERSLSRTERRISDKSRHRALGGQDVKLGLWRQMLEQRVKILVADADKALGYQILHERPDYMKYVTRRQPANHTRSTLLDMPRFVDPRVVASYMTRQGMDLSAVRAMMRMPKSPVVEEFLGDGAWSWGAVPPALLRLIKKGQAY